MIDFQKEKDQERKRRAKTLSSVLFPEIVILSRRQNDGRLDYAWWWQTSEDAKGLAPSPDLQAEARDFLIDPEKDVKTVQGIRIQGSERASGLVRQSRIDKASIALWEAGVDACLQHIQDTHPRGVALVFQEVFEGVGEGTEVQIDRFTFLNPKTWRSDAPKVQARVEISPSKLFKNRDPSPLLVPSGATKVGEELGLKEISENGAVYEFPYDSNTIAKFESLELVIMEGMLVALDRLLKSEDA